VSAVRSRSASEVIAHIEKNSVVPHGPWMKGQSPCRIWTLGCDSAGYGMIFFDNKTYKVHRFIYLNKVSEIPHGMLILHSCDTPSCNEISHLRLGTHSDNAHDKVMRGRCKSPTGNAHGSKTCPGRLPSGDNHFSRKFPEKLRRGTANNKAKFTDSDVLNIRGLHQRGETVTFLGARFGVHRETIRRLINKKTWMHIS